MVEKFQAFFKYFFASCLNYAELALEGLSKGPLPPYRVTTGQALVCHRGMV